jgi:2-methylisocitrate lyase-like PEP mutase family enzyme
MTHAAALRRRLAQPEALKVPGVFDGLSALLVERAGFEAAFLSGASLAYTRFGRPDLGLVSFAELLGTVRTLRERTVLPLIVDIDTGFGNALNVARTVRELEKAGASALQMEDQVAPKRCGHMRGKQVVSTGEMVGKIRAALDARRDAATMIVARTDALTVEGFEAALERAGRYVEAGADLLFVEAPSTREQMCTIAARFAARVPLVHNLVEGGRSPVATAAELHEVGYRVGLYPAMLAHLFARQAEIYLRRLQEEGGTTAFAGELHDIESINRLLGAPELLELAARYA